MQIATASGGITVASSSCCPRCGTVGGYLGRPCPICYSPSLVALKDSVLLDAEGKLFPVPEQVKIFLHGGRRIRAPRRARAIAALRMVTRWTWRSLVFAAVVHLVLVMLFFFIQGQLQEVVRERRLTLEAEPVMAMSTPADVPKAPNDLPDEKEADEILITPQRVLVEPVEESGDPEFEAPPERLTYAPLPMTAPPEPVPPRFDISRPTRVAEGLGGGQPDPSVRPVPAGSGLFENRQGETRKAALERFGGDANTENAVEMALEFLARTQTMDGSWDPTGQGGIRTFRDGASMGDYMRNPISALCVLPFLAAGHSPTEGKYSIHVRRTINRIVRMQTSDGCLAPFDHNQMYTHCVATLAMCEAYGMTQDKTYLRSAERAVRYLERTQSAKGGWTYMAGLSTPDNAGSPLRNDLSISGWAVLAFKSAKAVGIHVSDRVWKAMGELFDTMSLPSGETYYADDSPYAWRKGIGMVGVGLTSRVILDRERFEPRNDAARKVLMENRPDWERFSDPSRGSTHPNFNTFYGWYYSTLGLFLHTGGEGLYWTRWNEALKKQLLQRQETRGNEKGSWDPADNWIGPMMGRLYSTACACLCLEVYYRYTPTFRSDDIKPGAPRPPVVETPAGPKTEVVESPSRPAEIGGEVLDLAKAADRAKYLRLLAKEKGLGATPSLIDALRDESSTVRSTALSQLAMLKASDACKDVLAMLRRDENRDLRSSVVYTLGELGNKDAASTLISLLSDTDTMVADQAHRALVALAGGKDLGVNPQSWRSHFEK